MNEVGKAIRDAHHWVKWDPQNVQESDVMCLMMDNAGGHGSNEAVEKYTEDLKNKYKIEIMLLATHVDSVRFAPPQPLHLLPAVGVSGKGGEGEKRDLD